MGEAPLRLPSVYMKISPTTLEEFMSTVQGGCWAAMLCASWGSALRMVKSIGRWPTAGIHTGVRTAISGLSGAPTTVESRTWLQHQVLMPNGAAVTECQLLSEHCSLVVWGRADSLELVSGAIACLLQFVQKK